MFRCKSLRKLLFQIGIVFKSLSHSFSAELIMNKLIIGPTTFSKYFLFDIRCNKLSADCFASINILRKYIRYTGSNICQKDTKSSMNMISYYFHFTVLVVYGKVQYFDQASNFKKYFEQQKNKA